MSKAFEIVTGTAEEVSARVTHLQNEGWLLRDGFVYTHLDDKTVYDNRMIPRGGIKLVPLFAQPMYRKWDNEPVERHSSVNVDEEGE